MTTPRATLEELEARSQAEIESKLDGAQARLFGTPESVLATVSAGHAHGLYGRVERAERQIFVQHMDDEWLDAALATWGLSDGAGGFGRLAAVQATGKAIFTGASPAEMPTGREVKIGDEIYTIDSGYTYVAAASEDHEFDVTAKVAGSAGNAIGGATISLVTPIAGIVSDGTVSPLEIKNGSDIETIEAARERLLEKIRSAGAGGADGDYVVFAKAASVLVTRAWELPRENGQGTMLLLIANDNETPPTADSTLIDTVQEALQDTDANGKITGVAPTTAILTVGSVGTKALSVTAAITLEDGAIWQDDDGEGVKKDVTAEIAALVERVAEPEVTITLEEIAGAIQRAAGVSSHTLTVPGADVTHTSQQIPYIGTHTLTEA
jgi:uncharacterized phage protein gp47/JayE